MPRRVDLSFVPPLLLPGNGEELLEFPEDGKISRRLRNHNFRHMLGRRKLCRNLYIRWWPGWRSLQLQWS